MSCDFNGTTSKLEHTTATGYDTATLTVVGWIFPDTTGEGGAGTLFITPEGASEGIGTGFWVVRYNTTTNTLRVRAGFATTIGTWTFPVTDAAWNAVAISHSVVAATPPVVRVNFADVTETQVAAGSGARQAVASGYCIGNRSDSTRTWNGAIQHVQFFNVILTAEEMDAALLRPGSIQRGLVSWWPMWDANYTVDLVNHAFQPTATALNPRAGAPCAPPWAGAFGWRGAFTAAPPPAAMAVPPRRDILFFGPWGPVLDAIRAAAAADEIGAQVLFMGSISPLGLLQTQVGKVRR